MKQLVSAIPILLLLAAAPTPAAAQSISPPISEYRGLKARGSFIVTNQTLFPLTVVLQPKGFKVTEDGDLVRRAARHRRREAPALRDELPAPAAPGLHRLL